MQPFSSAEVPDRHLGRSLVLEATENKYAGDDQNRLAAFEEGWRLAANARSASELTGLSQPPSDADADIANQVIVLFLIERVWKLHLPENPVLAIHRVLTGTSNDLTDVRTTDQVADYQGSGLVDVKEVPSRRDEFERMYCAIVPKAVASDIDLKTSLLAFIFAAIVRIHPFADANGRTARFAVQLALRAWGLPLLPLPKVRNDPGWSVALARAVETGEMNPLENELRARLGSLAIRSYSAE